MQSWLTEQFELRPNAGRGGVRAMEGLRGFATLLVFLAHFSSQVRPWVEPQSALWQFNRAVTDIGMTGVDLFFVLSGVLIYGSLISRQQSFQKFMMRRIERLYPAFVPVFLLYVVLSFVFPAENKIPSAPGEAVVYLVQNFLLLPGVFPIRPMITVAWSLSYEMLFYLACPAVIALVRLRERDVAWRIRFILFMAAVTSAALIACGGSLRVIMFCSGILLSETINSLTRPAPGSAVACIALTTGFLGSLEILSGRAGTPLTTGILFVSVFVFCWSCLGHRDNWLSRAFSWTPIRWLGNMGYSYYLLHGLALKFCFLVLAQFVPPASHGPVWYGMLLLAMFAFTLVPAAALFLLVERPWSLEPARSAREGTSQAQTAVPSSMEPSA